MLRAVRAFLGVLQPGNSGAVKGHPRHSEGQEDSDGVSDDDWETSGCLLWDIAAIPEQADLLMSNNIRDILQTVIVASINQQHWRALEISLGTLANLACHKAFRNALLSTPALAELVLDRALWVDDAPSLGEACRLLSVLCLTIQVRA